MKILDLIEKKQSNIPLSQQEIDELVVAYVNDEIPDYQMSAFLMAIYFQGMTDEEIQYLTMAIVNSGDHLDLSQIHGVKVDKHSTGGVGDTTTLVLGPLVASLGIPVAKMSGRGLGHTGGTIDKLESIPGFRTDISVEEFIELVNTNSLAVIGQTGNLTPADKKIYALRDVTGTVQSIPLIASSIMSKKIASGADAIVLDVKVGDGAFMKNIDEAQHLAETMVNIGNQVGRKTIAILSAMNQPLGEAVGNNLEIIEAIHTLQGKGPEDLTKLCLVLGANMLIANGHTDDFSEAKDLLSEQLRNGQAFDKFVEFIKAQGGDTSYLYDTSLFPKAKHQISIKANTTGYITGWDAHEVGEAARILGAGRLSLQDQIQPEVGVVLNKKIGSHVEKGEQIAVLHSNQLESHEAIQRMLDAVTIGNESIEPVLILDRIA
ncbi:pyrimidine-nucleoside phosphorylase [Aerococcaceae bacterium DSM 111020]|nr:pyrimidine-nucleoside phosphorylase [Aerococcaceae bacterium DSM 111020]